MSHARRFLEGLAAGRFVVGALTDGEYGMILGLHDQSADLGAGLADLSVEVLAHRYRTLRLLTFDERDFRRFPRLAVAHSFCSLQISKQKRHDGD